MITTGDYTIAYTGLQKIIADYYTLVDDMLEKNDNTVYVKEIYGDNTVNDDYNRTNDFTYLLVLLIIIYYDMKNNENNGKIYTSSYYWNAYDIECIRKYFYCNGYSISPLLSLFSL
jgi:hypothetical protein